MVLLVVDGGKENVDSVREIRRSAPKRGPRYYAIREGGVLSAHMPQTAGHRPRTSARVRSGKARVARVEADLAVGSSGWGPDFDEHLDGSRCLRGHGAKLRYIHTSTVWSIMVE